MPADTRAPEPPAPLDPTRLPEADLDALAARVVLDWTTRATDLPHLPACPHCGGRLARPTYFDRHREPVTRLQPPALTTTWEGSGHIITHMASRGLAIHMTTTVVWFAGPRQVTAASRTIVDRGPVDRLPRDIATAAILTLAARPDR